MGFISWLLNFLKPEENTQGVRDRARDSLVVKITTRAAPQGQPKKPRKPRRSKDEIEAERAQQRVWLRKQSIQRAKEERAQQMGLGITHYTWQSSGDERTCDACAANDGKRFSWDNPPAIGHPDESTCCEEGHCRCCALAYLDLDKMEREAYE